MFFEFDQNNSGGEYVINTELGIGEKIIIEAKTAQEAEKKFKALGQAHGLGFYSYCDCCGERWFGVTEEMQTLAYNDIAIEHYPIARTAVEKMLDGYIDADCANLFIHFADGTIHGAVYSFREFYPEIFKG